MVVPCLSLLFALVVSCVRLLLLFVVCLLLFVVVCGCVLLCVVVWLFIVGAWFV